MFTPKVTYSLYRNLRFILNGKFAKYTLSRCMLSCIDSETLLLHGVKRGTAVHGARKQERLLQRLQNNGFDINLALVLLEFVSLSAALIALFNGKVIVS